MISYILMDIITVGRHSAWKDTAIKPQHVHYRSDEHVNLHQKLRETLKRVNPSDIISTRLHSRDFLTSRAEAISIRIRTLSLIFAGLALLWIPIDFMLLDGGMFWQILILRVLFSTSLFALGYWGTNCNHLTTARLRIFLFLLIPSLFFLISHQLFNGSSTDNAILLGYAFLPLLMMALLAVVPLTLLEGISYTGMLILFFVVTKLLLGTLFELQSLADLWLLLLLALIALWIQMSQLHMLMRLYREATRDALTGLVNRRVLSTKLEQEIAANNDKLVLLLFDLDLFKRINDTYGHHTGDSVLKAFAEILGKFSHKDYTMGRYGGEEFMAILPNTPLDKARELAESIRVACHDYKVHSTEDDSVVIDFTTSIGVATRKPGESATELLNRVDQGLYNAKSSGRDLVVVAD